MPERDWEGEFVAVLAMHYATGGFAPRYARPGHWGCSCGAGGDVESGERVVDHHRAHVAAQLATLTRFGQISS